METDDAPFTPLSVLRSTCIQSYGYTDQRKVEADFEVTEDPTGDLSLRKPRTSQLILDRNILFCLTFFIVELSSNCIDQIFFPLTMDVLGQHYVSNCT